MRRSSPRRPSVAYRILVALGDKWSSIGRPEIGEQVAAWLSTRSPSDGEEMWAAAVVRACFERSSDPGSPIHQFADEALAIAELVGDGESSRFLSRHDDAVGAGGQQELPIATWPIGHDLMETGDMSEGDGGGARRAWLVVNQPGRPPMTVELDRELTIGRDVGEPPVPGHLTTAGDPGVSRLHAMLQPKPTGWCVQATAAVNGLFVNGTRLAPGAVHLLAAGDELRLGERTALTFQSLGASAADRSLTEVARPRPELTAGERRVLLALCSPVLDGDAFTPPASVSTIAEMLSVSESAIKQQLGRLYLKFGVDEGTDRRVRLANEALTCGAVRLADLQAIREAP